MLSLFWLIQSEISLIIEYMILTNFNTILGKKLINFSILIQIIEFIKFAVKSFENEINIVINVIYPPYGIVILYILPY